MIKFILNLYSINILLYIIYFDFGFSFFFLNNAFNPISATWTTLNLTPGKSPTACPFLPNPAISTLSFSSMNSILPSPGTKATIDLLFFFN